MQLRKRLGEILIDLRVLTELEVERVLLALSRRDIGKFGQVAKEMGLLREEHVLAALAVQMDLLPRADRLSLSRLLNVLARPPLLESSRPTASPGGRKQVKRGKAPVYPA